MFSLKPLPIYRSHLLRFSQRSLTITTTTTPPETGHALLTTRRLIALSGQDAPHFLQGLTTANIPSSSPPTTGLYSAFLNASGRVLHDVFIYPASHSAAYRSTSPSATDHNHDPAFLIEVDARETDRLAAHLRRFKLRAKIQIRILDETEWSVWSAWGPSPSPSPPIDIGCHDPRAPTMGLRLILPGTQPPTHLSPQPARPVAHYDRRRLASGVAEGQREIVRDTALPLESNMDAMGGIDFRKGCYVGQELTIRTRHTGVVRKRILPVALYDTPGRVPVSLTPNNDDDGEGEERITLPPAGANIVKAGGKGRSAGRWLRGMGNVGLALCRLESMTGSGDEFRVVWGEGEGQREVWVRAFVPGWLRERARVGVGVGEEVGRGGDG